MTARTRLWVLVVSTPVIAFTLVGGYLGQAMTRDETLRSLRVFEDVDAAGRRQLRRERGRAEGNARRDARADRRPGRGQHLSEARIW